MHFGIIDARMYTGNHPDSCVKFFFYWAPDSNPIHSSRYSTNTSRKFAVQKQLFMPNVSVTDL